MPASDTKFVGKLPELYDRTFVPLIFEPYAIDLAARAAELDPRRVLELACGTGAVTRHLARVLPAATEIIASDLNQPMIDRAAQIGTARPVEWRQIDAQQLPFGDGELDLVLCQFGAMFFPDRAGAYAEARRVLRPGGTFLFNVWDRIETNEPPHVVCESLTRAYPGHAPWFLERVPHGYFDPAQIAADLARAGFTAPRIAHVTHASRAESPESAAFAFCQATLMRNDLDAIGKLEEGTALAAAALAARFGTGAITGQIAALVVEATR